MTGTGLNMPPGTLRWQAESMLPASTEIATLTACVQQRPQEPMYWLRLARLLASHGRHAQAHELSLQALARFPDLHALKGVLGECENALGRPEAARAWLQAVPDDLAPGTVAHALYELGAAQESLDRPDDAARAYGRALDIKPEAPHPCRALHRLMRSRGDIDAVLGNCQALRGRGVHHARLHADWMVATAINQRKDEALDLFAFDAFSRFESIEDDDIAGGPWADLQGFNAALADELSSHPDIHHGRRNVASRDAWRVQNPFSGFGRPALARLSQCVRGAVERHVAGLPASSDHFFVRGVAPACSTSSWAVKVRSNGFEDWHVHPGGWLTAVYYVKVPAVESATDDTHEGGITFGLPDYEGMPDAGADWTHIHPRAGLLGLFPSHCFHRTWPTRVEQDRWVVVFDVLPVAA
jgi:Tfp pilus assembly protein PilF